MMGIDVEARLAIGDSRVEPTLVSWLAHGRSRPRHVLEVELALGRHCN